MEGKISRGTFAEYLEIDRAGIDDYLDAAGFVEGNPFDLRLPDKETLHAMDDIENSRNLESADTVEEMFKKIGV